MTYKRDKNIGVSQVTQYIIAIDQGTTSSRAIIFDKKQNIVGMSQKEFSQFYPTEGWIEHDPIEIWATQYGVLQEAMAKARRVPRTWFCPDRKSVV